MTQKCAIVKSLLEGKVLSIMNGFQWFGCTNVPREIGRSVERDFNVEVDRISKEGTSRYGQATNYTEYRLLRTERNKTGIIAMEKYVQEIEGKPFSPAVNRGPKITHRKAPTSQHLNLFDM